MLMVYEEVQISPSFVSQRSCPDILGNPRQIKQKAELQMKEKGMWAKAASKQQKKKTTTQHSFLKEAKKNSCQGRKGEKGRKERSFPPAKCTQQPPLSQKRYF